MVSGGQPYIPKADGLCATGNGVNKSGKLGEEIRLGMTNSSRLKLPDCCHRPVALLPLPPPRRGLDQESQGHGRRQRYRRFGPL